jgi:hypothetical protein
VTDINQAARCSASAVCAPLRSACSSPIFAPATSRAGC